ncbi:MAG: Uma2 family endonuclease [Isosphaeraceae bacterium]|jgi:Uma2 family endonuclease
MSVAVTTENKTLCTPEDLLAMPDGKNYELVDGRLVERNMGAESSWIGGRIFLRLSLFCDEHQLGYVWPADNGYQCFAHAPKLVRRPDVSFIRAGRLPGGELPKGHVRIPPDLAVEVVSRNDLASELDEKVEDYQKAGVGLVWVIHPESGTASVYRSDGSVSRLHQDDELSGEEVIPGFRCRVRSLFPGSGKISETVT